MKKIVCRQSIFKVVVGILFVLMSVHLEAASSFPIPRLPKVEHIQKCPKPKRGHRGHRGDRGKRGKRGFSGSTGSSGVQGPVGPTGPSSTFSPEFAYIYDDTAQVVASGGDVTFSSNGPMSSGMTHIPTQAGITVNISGTYFVYYYASDAPSVLFDIAVNGGALPETGYSGTLNKRMGVLIQLNAGDVVTLHNSSGGPTTLLNTAGQSAALSIVQISS